MIRATSSSISHPKERNRAARAHFISFPVKPGEETRRGHNDGENHDLRFILSLVAPEFMVLPPLCRSAEAERRRLWAAKLFAGYIRVRRRCLLSKIREKYLHRIYICIEISPDIFTARWHLSDDEEKDLN